MIYTIVAVFLVKMKDAFGVRTCSKLVTAFDQTRIQLRKVVGLTIEDNPQRFILIGNRLVATFDVDDGKSPHPQAYAWFDMEAVTIRPTVDNRFCHCFDRELFRDRLVGVRNSTNAAH